MATPIPAPQDLRAVLEREARIQGFSEVRVAAPAPFTKAARRALEAIGEGRMEGMAWYTPTRVEAARDLRPRFPWAKSLVSLAYPYRPTARPGARAPEAGPGRGRIAAYAQGDDYHRRLERGMKAVLKELRSEEPGIRGKTFVDHGWALDRAIAERSGLGFCGKNTQLITPEHGSYVLLGALLLSASLAPDPPSRRSCGSCSRCLPACPTGALIRPGVLDSRRCISYLTIEHQGPVPSRLRPLIGDWVFGCDLCQEACPINARLAPAPVEVGPAVAARGAVPFPDLVDLLQLDQAAFEQRYAGTPLLRSGRERLARNAAIALGNRAEAAAVTPLGQALAEDRSPTVRGACAWALGRLRGAPGALRLLRSALRTEQDPAVFGEIQEALTEPHPSSLRCEEVPVRHNPRRG